MKALRIDFAPSGWRRTLYRTHPAAWVAAAIAALALGAAVAAAFRLHAEQEEYERQLAEAGVRARQVAARAPRPVAQPRVPEAQAAAVNAIVSQLNLPWRAVHDALAAGTPASIALLALEPDARRHTLRITAEARDSDGMVGYVEQLKRQELFSDVVLVSHLVNDADPNKPLRFELEATWSAP
ncbi:PilN domain-containing protein [Pseudoduganella sp. GCM10020061]|uniref:PilN domain-containing protein n=1 Tax=Pseudoduganella sp. GCM10020061 TaxID=3317345 RepID=UPI0036325516